MQHSWYGITSNKHICRRCGTIRVTRPGGPAGAWRQWFDPPDLGSQPVELKTTPDCIPGSWTEARVEIFVPEDER